MSGNTVEIPETNNPFSIDFHDGEKTFGRFEWKDGAFVFEGNAEESCEKFLILVKEKSRKWIEENYTPKK